MKRSIIWFLQNAHVCGVQRTLKKKHDYYGTIHKHSSLAWQRKTTARRALWRIMGRVGKALENVPASFLQSVHKYK
jgi:hypothetical protein